MAKPTTVDQLTAGLHAQPYKFYKNSQSGRIAGSYTDLGQVPGIPGFFATPTISGVACDRNTIGAIAIPGVTAGKEQWLNSLSGFCSVAGTLIFHDRLVQYGGINGTLTTVQALGAVPLPRHASGVGVVPYLVYWASGGATSVSATISYTNQDGVAGRTSIIATPASSVLGQCVPYPLQGDSGCRSVQSIRLSATTGAASNIGLFLAHEKAVIGGVASEGKSQDWLALGMPEIEDGACLSAIQICSGATTGFSSYLLSLSDV